MPHGICCWTGAVGVKDVVKSGCGGVWTAVRGTLMWRPASELVITSSKDSFPAESGALLLPGTLSQLIRHCAMLGSEVESEASNSNVNLLMRATTNIYPRERVERH